MAKRDRDLEDQRGGRLAFLGQVVEQIVFHGDATKQDGHNAGETKPFRQKIGNKGRQDDDDDLKLGNAIHRRVFQKKRCQSYRHTEIHEDERTHEESNSNAHHKTAKEDAHKLQTHPEDCHIRKRLIDKLFHCPAP